MHSDKEHLEAVNQDADIIRNENPNLCQNSCLYDVLHILWRSARIRLERGTTSVISRSACRIKIVVSVIRRARCMGVTFGEYVSGGRPHTAHISFDKPIQNSSKKSFTPAKLTSSGHSSCMQSKISPSRFAEEQRHVSGEEPTLQPVVVTALRLVSMQDCCLRSE